MGSRNDFAVMRGAVEMLGEFGVPHEARVVSAHRTPDLLFEYAQTAVARGLRVIIAGAGGAAHLPGMVAAKTVVPVLGVPIAGDRAARDGLAVEHCADAEGRAGGNAGDWRGGRGERWPAGGADSGDDGRGVAGEDQRVAGGAARRGAGAGAARRRLRGARMSVSER